MKPQPGEGIFGELRDLSRVYRGLTPRPSADREVARVAVVLGTQVLADGGPSRTLRERTLHGARLYGEGRVEKVLVTGGLGRYPPTEAEVMARILKDRGVPDVDVLVEERATSTWESARFVPGVLGDGAAGGVLAVTDPLHGVRAVAAFRKVGLRAFAEPVYSSPMWRDRWLRRGQFLRESGALIWYRMRHGVGARSGP